MLREALGVEVELIKGGRGDFIVRVDGNVVAKKSMMGFPTPDEIVDAVQAATKE